MPHLLEARALEKWYADHCALHPLDLHLNAGEVLCLLGPNGAGKTTTINLFLGFVHPTHGQALVGGIDSATDPLGARQLLAYIPENVMLYGPLSGIDNLRYFSSLANGLPMERSHAQMLLHQAGLSPAAMDQALAGYSKGMRQKVGIAIALARQASVLLLDEPTSGLDPLASEEFTRMIRRQSEQGMAVLMVTHDLLLAQQCASRIAIMQAGRMVRQIGAGSLDVNALQQAYMEASRQAQAQADTACQG